MIEYDSATKTWRVQIPNWGIEEGGLQYVVGEYIGDNLYYPYDTEQTRIAGHHGHAHEFDGVLMALLRSPIGFSVAGFEEYYSRQELHLLNRLQEKLLGEERQ